MRTSPARKPKALLIPMATSTGIRCSALYVGVPLVERYAADPLMPDCIYIYRLPILSMCDTHDAVVREVRTTLLHEIGHYLGLSEQDLDRLGYG